MQPSAPQTAASNTTSLPTGAMIFVGESVSFTI
jgi:hypothetical protein